MALVSLRLDVSHTSDPLRFSVISSFPVSFFGEDRSNSYRMLSCMWPIFSRVKAVDCTAAIPQWKQMNRDLLPTATLGYIIPLVTTHCCSQPAGGTQRTGSLSLTLHELTTRGCSRGAQLASLPPQRPSVSAPCGRNSGKRGQITSVSLLFWNMLFFWQQCFFFILGFSFCATRLVYYLKR